MDEETSLYENLLRATDNLTDITFTRYATVTKLLANYRCNIKESDNELTHTDVPILNGLNVETGDTVIVGFAQNSLYNPYIIGVMNREITSSTDLDKYTDDIIYDIQKRLELELTTPVDHPCEIQANLSFDNSPYANKELQLYEGDKLLSNQKTDSAGLVTFRLTTASSDTITYRVSYDDKVSEEITKTDLFTTETIPLESISEIICLTECGLLSVTDNTFISSQEFKNLKHYRGKGYIKKSLPHMENWEIEFSAYTANHALTEGYILLKWSDVPITLGTILQNCIGFRTMGYVDVYKDEVNQRQRVGTASHSEYQWNYNRVHIKLKKQGTHYTVTFTMIENPSYTYTLEFDSDVFDNSITSNKGTLHLVIATDCHGNDFCNFHNQDIELYNVSFNYPSCAGWDDYKLTVATHEISTSTTQATITANLQINGVNAEGRTIRAYYNGNLVGSGTTNSSGMAFIQVISETGTTKKYSIVCEDNLAVDECTVEFLDSTFPLDGTDTIVNLSGTAYSENGELFFGYGSRYLTDYYLDNTGLWEASLEYYQTLSNWDIVLAIVGQESNKYGFTYNYNGQLSLGRISGGYSTYNLGEDFVFKTGEWTKVTFKKISTNQLTITVGEHSTTITDDRIAVPEKLHLMFTSSQSEIKKIRHIIFNPAIPNE